MSGFDDNFFNDEDENPFKDPAVTQVTNNTNVAQAGLADYDPFKDEGPSPAILKPSAQEVTVPAPQYTKTAQQQVQKPLSEFERRQEELDRKAAELDRREQQLNQQTTYNARRNNWPPMPEGFCVEPCFYQDINVEIPLEFQRIVRHLYYLWIFHGCVMVLNLIGGLILLFLFGDFYTFGVGLLYLLLFTPFSFLCWYRPVYKAFRSDSSFNFMVFFFVFFFQTVITTIQTVGFNNSGTCGFLLAIHHFDGSGKGIFAGVLILLIAICFAVAAAGEFLLLMKVHSIYRSSGASWAKAQQEFTSEFMKNEHVQNMATNAAAATIRSQMGQNRR